MSIVGDKPIKPLAPSSGGDITRLEQQKKSIQEELKRVKDNDTLPPEAKEKRIELLEKKLQKIEDAMQKVANAQAKKSEPSTADKQHISSDKALSSAELEEQQSLKRKFERAGDIIDKYI